MVRMLWVIGWLGIGLATIGCPPSGIRGPRGPAASICPDTDALPNLVFDRSYSASTSTAAFFTPASVDGIDNENQDAFEDRDDESISPLRRSCRGDSYFVEVGIRVDPPWGTDANAFFSAVRSYYDSRLNGAPPLAREQFFYDPVDKACSESVYGPVRLEFREVLWPAPANSPPDQREYLRGAQHRFLRASFATSLEGCPPLRVRPQYHCEVVDRIRSVLSSVSVAGDIKVGRDCEGIALAGEAGHILDDAYDWHVDREDPLPARVLSNLGQVRVALLDTALNPAQPDFARPDVGPRLRRYWSREDVCELSPHGIAMGNIIRSMAPNVPIWPYRVMSAGGFATTESVARGLYAATLDARRDQPTIINMSLGFPPEQTRRVPITGLWLSNLIASSTTADDLPLNDETCSNFEDGVGESIRYLLTSIRELDGEGVPIAVSAAVGNRSNFTDLNRSGALQPTCGDPSRDNRWFFPGAWAQVPSCAQNGSEVDLAITTAAAITSSCSPSLLPTMFPRGDYPRLGAYGQHVVARYSEVNPVLGRTFPLPFSGTSVSTAIVSGVMATAQAARLANDARALTAPRLRNLLEATGVVLTDPLLAGTRMVSRSNVIQAITPDPAAPPYVLKQELAACAENTDDADALRRCIGARRKDPRCVCEPRGIFKKKDRYLPNERLRRVRPSIGNPVPPIGLDDRPGLGNVGPQPPCWPCPTCMLYAIGPVNPVMVALQFEFTTEFEPGTYFTDAVLVIRGPVTGNPENHQTFSQPLDGGPWSPGETIDIPDQPLEQLSDYGELTAEEYWERATVQMRMTMHPPGADPVVEYVPLGVSP
jgi:hypothetical protein